MAKAPEVEARVRDICRQNRRRQVAGERILIVLEGLKGEERVAELCRREGIDPNLYSARGKMKRQTPRRRVRISGRLPVRPEERILPIRYRVDVA
jgi:transposase